MGWTCKNCGSKDFYLVSDIVVERTISIIVNKKGIIKKGDIISESGYGDTDREHFRCAGCGIIPNGGYSGELEDISEWVVEKRKLETL